VGFFLIKNIETSSRVFGQVHSNHSSTKGLLMFSAATRSFRGLGPMRGLMFRMPAYDPFAIAVMGFGILLAAASLLTNAVDPPGDRWSDHLDGRRALATLAEAE
jgi:hypothetical protein